MRPCIGLRKEDKNEWERRVPVVPDHVRELREEGVDVYVQPSDIRVFKEFEYTSAGASTSGDLSECPTVFGIKEIPVPFFREGVTYVFFSHTIKGQEYNMPMLRQMMAKGCNLIDYERVMDDKGRRLIFFGRHAGVAGMLESLYALGQRLNVEGVDSPFTALKRPLEYDSIGELKAAMEVLGRWISTGAIPPSIRPLVVGFAGYGNVSRGAQEILEILPFKEVAPGDIASLSTESEGADRTIFKVVFKEEDMVRPVEEGGTFGLQDYYKHPERYVGVFEDYLPYMTVLMNCVYWDERYPRLVTKRYLSEGWAGTRLKVIGDISCDIGGGVEATVHPAEPGSPTYVYDVETGEVTDGIEGNGPVIMAVDILPAELPRDSSMYFSGVIKEYVPAIAKADFSVEFEDLDLPPPIKRAVILHRGELTPDYKYISQYLEKEG